MADWGWVGYYVDDEHRAALDDVVPMQNDRHLTTVPRWIAELAHEDYHRHHEQTFDRLHQRGGFSTGEVIGHLAAALLRERARRG